MAALPGVSLMSTGDRHGAVRATSRSQLGLENPIRSSARSTGPNWFIARAGASLKKQNRGARGHRREAGSDGTRAAKSMRWPCGWRDGHPAIPYHEGRRTLNGAEPGRLPQRAGESCRHRCIRHGTIDPTWRFVVQGARERSSTIKRNRAARDGRARGRYASHLLACRRHEWRSMLEQNGELTDASRAARQRSYATGVGCRHRILRILRRTTRKRAGRPEILYQ